MDKNLTLRGQNSIKRGTVIMAGDSTKLQTVQVNTFLSETFDSINRFQEFGFSSIPLAVNQANGQGAECIVLQPDWVAGNAVAICMDDRRFRPVGGNPGDVCMYSASDNQAPTAAASAHRIALEQSNGRQITIRTAGGHWAEIVVSDSGTITITNDQNYTIQMNETDLRMETTQAQIILNNNSITFNAPIINTYTSGGSGGAYAGLK